MKRSMASDPAAVKRVIIDGVDENSSSPKQVELQKGNSSSPMPLIDDDLSPLSKPYVCFILAKSHVNPAYNMVLPSRLYPYLPSTRSGSDIRVPATIEYHGRAWKITLTVGPKQRRLDRKSWKAFVNDNNLRFGDALFVELNESSNEKVEFKVQIIRGDFPAELEAKVSGVTPNTPIILD